MRNVIACRHVDAEAKITPKYANRGKTWGTNATRAVDTEVSALSESLSRFLASNCPRVIAGRWPHRNLNDRVRCFNGLSEADMVRRERKPHAESLIVAYGLERIPCVIEDWLFPLIEPEETGEHY